MDEKVSSSKSWIDNKVYGDIMSELSRLQRQQKMLIKSIESQNKRELMSCDGCVFCIDFYASWCVPPTTRFLCNLGLDTKFHVRNGYDDLQIGCKNINPNPTTPCKARYTDEEMRKLLGV